MHIKLNKKELMLLNLNLRAFIARMYIKDSEDVIDTQNKETAQQFFIVGNKKDGINYKENNIYIVQFKTAEICEISQTFPKGCDERFKEIPFSELVAKFETEELNFISNEMDDDSYFVNLYLGTFTSGYLWHIKGLPDFEDKMLAYVDMMNYNEFGMANIFLDDHTWIYAGEEDKYKKLQLEMLVGIMNQLLPYELKLDYFEETDKYYIVDDDRHSLEANYSHLATIIYEAIMLILDGTK